MRTFLKAALAAALYYTGVLWLLRLLAARRGAALIITYHAVDPDLKAATPAELEAGIVVTGSTLRRQLRHLKRRHRIVRLDQLAHAAASGEGSMGGSCAITFDDAIAGLAEHALPVLIELQLPATVFAPSDYVDSPDELPAWRLRRLLGFAGDALQAAEAHKLKGRETVQAVAAQIAAGLTPSQREVLAALPPRRVLTSDALQHLARTGIAIGSHGACHDPLPGLPEAVQQQELGESKARLERIVGEPVTCLTYPHGAACRTTAAVARDTGYACACTTRSGPVCPGDDPYLLHRIAADECSSTGIRGSFSPSLFEAMLQWRTWWPLGLRLLGRLWR